MGKERSRDTPRTHAAVEQKMQKEKEVEITYPVSGVSSFFLQRIEHDPSGDRTGSGLVQKSVNEFVDTSHGVAG